MRNGACLFKGMEVPKLLKHMHQVHNKMKARNLLSTPLLAVICLEVFIM